MDGDVPDLLKFLHVESYVELTWIAIGIFGQLLFSARFVLQWIASERLKRSVIPVAFWYCSLGGSVVLLSYSLYRFDPVFILGQVMGLVIYIRNLRLIWNERRQARATGH